MSSTDASVSRNNPSRRWCFTLNNPSLDFSLGFENMPNLRYAIAQLESGELETPHYQGYMEFTQGQRLSALKKIYPTAHFEIAKGTRDQARDYCRKPETQLSPPIEYGNWTAGGQGQRMDIATSVLGVKRGLTDLELAETDPTTWIKYYKGLREYRTMLLPPRDHIMEVEVYWGPTGTGKTLRAKEENPNAYFLPKGKWWDGYQQEDCVIIDEFYGWLPFDYLLRLLDRYPMRVEFKGGFHQFNSKKIVITSNKPPEDWYTDEKTHVYMPALLRRITKVIYMGGDQHYDPVLKQYFQGTENTKNYQ